MSMNNFIKTLWQRFRGWLREPGVIWRSETSKMRITIEVQQWIAFPAFLIALIWYLAAPSPVVLMSAVALGGMLLSAYLWARAMARGVRGRRVLRFAAMQVGDELEEEISLQNNTPLHVIWAEFIDHSNIPGYTVSSARAAEPGSQVEWRAHTICTRRGVFKLGPWELRLGEPFGILRIRQVYLQHQEILVYPPLALLPESVLPHHGALGDHRPLNQPLRAETIASTTVRAYVPGDPLRQIHWKTTARRNDPFVKVFSPEAASNVWLVPDFNLMDHTGETPNDSQEAMVMVVASLAMALLQQNLSVGLLASAEKETVVLPRQGQNHLWSILQALAPIFAVPERPLEDVLTRARGLVSGNDLLVLVTPSLRPEWIAPLRRVSRSRGGNGRAEVILLDPVSFEIAHETDPRHSNGKQSARLTAERFLTLLVENGITANILRRENIQPISGYYGEVSRWEFSVLGTGRAVARKTPRSVRPLSEEGEAQPVAWKGLEG